MSTKPIRNQLLVLWLAITVLIGAGWWIVALSRISSGSEPLPQLVVAPQPGDEEEGEAVVRKTGSLSR